MDNVNPVDLSRLARELAMDILPIEQILPVHKLTPDDFRQIASMPTFQAMLDDMRRDWESASNTKNRVRMKAATGVEAALETVIADILDQDIPLAQRIEGLKTLAKLGELTDTQNTQATGERFSITIYTGSPEPAVSVSAPFIDRRGAEDA